MSTLIKPTLNKSAAAMAFAENKMTSAENVEKRIFHAPEGYRRLTINLREDLHKKLRFLAVEQDCTATDIIERLLVKELEK